MEAPGGQYINVGYRAHWQVASQGSNKGNNVKSKAILGVWGDTKHVE